jgi:hypothetical protein
MWTNENRGRYDRSRLRYPNDVTSEEWALIGALILPSRKGRTAAAQRNIVNDYFRRWDYDRTRHILYVRCRKSDGP